MSESLAKATSDAVSTTIAPPRGTHFLRRAKVIATGHTLYAGFNFFFDQILYVYVIYRMGIIAGGAIMTALSALGCAVTLLLYERMKIDWVGAGSIARLTTLSHPSWWQRIIIRAAKRGAIFIFCALCIFQDPFITTAYFRQGRFDGINARDWKIFLASVVVSNFYWTLRSGAVALLLTKIWNGLQPA